MWPRTRTSRSSTPHGDPKAFACFADPEREPEEIPLDQLSEYAVVGGKHAGEVAYLRVLADAPVLRDGVRLIDTPGLGGVDRAHEEITLRVLEDADALLLVLDAEQPVTDDEREVLRRAREHVAHVVIVANKAEGEYAEQLAFNEGALGERILPVSAMLAIEAQAMRTSDPDGYAMVREASRFDALEDAVRECASAVRRDRYSLLLERASAALDDLAAPDREQVELARDDADPSERLRELGEELERVSRLNPVYEVNMRVGHLRQETVDRFRAQVPPAFREIKERVGQDWDPAMAATLPVICEIVVKSLWADALTELRREARQLAKGLEAELKLGVKPRTALLDLARGSRGELPETYKPGDEVPPPLSPNSRTEAAMRRSMRVTMTAGAANLALAPLVPLAGIPGLNLVVLPLALPVGLFLGHREEQSVRSRAARQAALSYVSECQASAAGLGNTLGGRVARLGENLGRQYQQRWLARRETLTRTIAQIKSASADVQAARARLAELEPLESTRDELRANVAGARHRPLYLGIDFGTTVTVAAGLYPGEEPVLVRFGSEPWTPSAVHLTTTGEMLVGRAAVDATAVDPAGGQLTPKSMVGSGLEVETLRGRPLPLVDARSAHVIAAAHRAAVEQLGAPACVALTCPVAWAAAGACGGQAASAASRRPARRRRAGSRWCWTRQRPRRTMSAAEACPWRRTSCSPSTTSAAAPATSRCSGASSAGSTRSRSRKPRSAANTSTGCCTSTCSGASSLETAGPLRDVRSATPTEWRRCHVALAAEVRGPRRRSARPTP